MFYSVKWYKVVRSFTRISVVGALGLLFLGIFLGMPAPAEARHRDISVVNIIGQVFGPYASQAMRVAQCESGMNAHAYNPTAIAGSHSAGVFQILYPSTWRGTSQAPYSPYNARANIIAAHDIFVHSGYHWRAWVCKP